MLRETGEVREARPGRAVILVRRSSACAACAARGVCLTFGGNERVIEVNDPVGVAAGDQVEIGIKPGRVVWASTVAYIFPVVAMLTGGFTGHALAPPGQEDLAAVIGTFLFLGVSLLGIWLWGKVTGSRDEQDPVVLRVLGPGIDH